MPGDWAADGADNSTTASSRRDRKESDFVIPNCTCDRNNDDIATVSYDCCRVNSDHASTNSSKDSLTNGTHGNNTDSRCLYEEPYFEWFISSSSGIEVLCSCLYNVTVESVYGDIVHPTDLYLMCLANDTNTFVWHFIIPNSNLYKILFSLNNCVVNLIDMFPIPTRQYAKSAFNNSYAEQLENQSHLNVKTVDEQSVPNEVTVSTVSHPSNPISTTRSDDARKTQDFHLVLDIVHGDDDSYVSLSKPGSPDMDTYQVASSEPEVHGTDGAVVAVLASVASALVAVVLLIVVCAIHDLLARRRDICNTRIRPYAAVDVY